MTGHALGDAFRHHAWATDRLMAACEGLSEGQLHSRQPSTDRGIAEIFQHMVGSESHYWSLFAGEFLPWDWDDDVLPPLSQLRAWAAELAACWEELLARGVDAEALLVRGARDGVLREVRAGVVLAQVLDHGSMHREQVCAILTSLGVELPHTSVWRYALEHGRDRVWAPPGSDEG